MNIEERLRKLEDEKAILDTLYAYGHHLDYGLEDAWIDCWTEDAVLDWPGRAFMRGHAELRAGFRSHSHAPAMYHKHMVLAPLITLQGDAATVQSMFARLDRYPEGPGIRAFGRYRDTLVRCADGKWRIKERLPEIEGARTQAPLGGEPFPDSPAMRQAAQGQPGTVGPAKQNAQQRRAFCFEKNRPEVHAFGIHQPALGFVCVLLVRGTRHWLVALPAIGQNL